MMPVSARICCILVFDLALAMLEYYELSSSSPLSFHSISPRGPLSLTIASGLQLTIRMGEDGFWGRDP